MAYRSSTGNLTHYDDPGPGPAQRWDRDKFERYSRRGGPPDESFHFEERDRYGPRGHTRTLEVDIDERTGRPHAPPPRPRYIDDLDDHRGFRRRPTDFLDEPTPTEVANRALAPYRGPPMYESPRPARPARPQYIRRQSSLDTFDRKPYPRYGDHEREYRPPVGVPIPLPVRSDRSRSSRPYEEDFEEIRYRDADPGYDDYEEDYRDIHIHRSRSRRRRASPSHKSQSRKSRSSSSSSESGRSPSPSVKSSRSHKTAKSSKTHKSSKSHKSHKSSRSHRSKSTHRTSHTSRTRSSSSSSSSFTEVEAELPGKKGKTKMPKRLVHIKAVEELGYPYEEEEDFIFVHRALGKEQIDEVIKMSESYKTNTTTYKYEKETDIIEVPPPPSSVTSASTHHTGHHSHHTSHTIHPPPPQSVISHHTSRSRAHSHAPPPPPPPVIYQPSHHGGTVYDEHIEESRHIHGPLTTLSPEAQHSQQLVRRRSESEIREDIRNLEIERRTIRDERERDFREYELVPVKDPPRDVVRVEKDRKACRRCGYDGPKKFYWREYPG